MRTEPSLRRASNSLSVAEWVVHGLGGSIAAETSLASRTGALAITSRQWWLEAIQCAGLAATIFPDLQPAGSPWGRVRAADGGLERLDGAVLTVAGHDHLVASVGSGATAAHQAMDSCGTAEALVRAIPADPARDPSQGLSRGISTGWHVLPDHYSLLAGLPLGIDLIPLLERLEASHRAGRTSLDDSALAFLDEQEADVEATPAARQWLVAVREAVGRAAASFQRLEELGGPITELHVSGGWASNPVLRRLKMDAFPNIVYPQVTEAGARGAALLAGQAAGVFASAEAFPPPDRGDELAAADRIRNGSPRRAPLSYPKESLLP
jgi:sugar (pentulose or hexulose) kinase